MLAMAVTELNSQFSLFSSLISSRASREVQLSSSFWRRSQASDVVKVIEINCGATIQIECGQKWWRSVKKKGGEGGKRTKDRCKFICDKKKQKCQTSPILLETVFGSFPLWCYFILAIVTQFTIIELYLLTHPATKMWILSPVFDDLRCYGKLGSRDFAWIFFWK